eukprot:130444_1
MTTHYTYSIAAECVLLTETSNTIICDVLHIPSHDLYIKSAIIWFKEHMNIIRLISWIQARIKAPHIVLSVMQKFICEYAKLVKVARINRVECLFCVDFVCLFCFVFVKLILFD